ncbi:MAG: amidase domain-containing protein [Cryobacterium sp.]
MALNRWQMVGLSAVVVASLGVAGVALATGGAGSPAQTAEATAPAPETPRATPSETPAPVAVVVDPAVEAQMTYVLAHWSDYNTADYGVVGANDCVNFTSQALIERGWEMDDQWWNGLSGDGYDASSPWVSSTAFMNYVADSGRATALTDDQRDLVKVGDVVQFDWDNSGDRDHTGIVSRVEGTGDDISISYAGHTDDTDYRTVDFAITENHPGGTAYYWSIP